MNWNLEVQNFDNAKKDNSNVTSRLDCLHILYQFASVCGYFVNSHNI